MSKKKQLSRLTVESACEQMACKKLSLKKGIDKGYKKLVMSELLLALALDDNEMVKRLTKEIGIRPRFVPDSKAKDKKALAFQSFRRIADAMNYDIFLKKRAKKAKDREILQIEEPDKIVVTRLVR
jgi:hypothetical protein